MKDHLEDLLWTAFQIKILGDALYVTALRKFSECFGRREQLCPEQIL